MKHFICSIRQISLLTIICIKKIQKLASNSLYVSFCFYLYEDTLFYFIQFISEFVLRNQYQFFEQTSVQPQCVIENIFDIITSHLQ